MKISKNIFKKGYTLIETLVASSVIMMAVAAASSLSLAMVTQEEASERAVRAANYLENAAALYRLGFNAAEIGSILPQEPAVVSLAITPDTVTVTDAGVINVADMTLVYKPSAATAATGAGSWTGGNKDTTRSHTVRVVRPIP